MSQAKKRLPSADKAQASLKQANRTSKPSVQQIN
jgi:hypothetical protein